LKPKQDIVLVGYGNIDEDTESPNGHKRWVHAPVVKRFTKTIDLGDSNHTNCFGDSGGPAYVQLEDGTWRVFGATRRRTKKTTADANPRQQNKLINSAISNR